MGFAIVFFGKKTTTIIILNNQATKLFKINLQCKTEFHFPDQPWLCRCVYSFFFINSRLSLEVRENKKKVPVSVHTAK